MTDDLRARLAAATETARECHRLSVRDAELRKGRDGLVQTLDALRAALAAQRRHVARLDGVSVARLLATVGGDRLARLEREHAEVAAAERQLAKAAARLAGIDDDIAALAARRRSLGDAPETFARLLDETERALVGAGEAGIASRVAERAEVDADLRRTRDAVRAAERAIGEIAAAGEALRIASLWCPSRALRRVRLHAAQRAAPPADAELTILNRKLAGVPGMPGVTGRVEVPSVFGTWDIGRIADLTLRTRIDTSRMKVDKVLAAAVAVHLRLVDRVRADVARLVELDAARLEAALGER